MPAKLIPYLQKEQEKQGYIGSTFIKELSKELNISKAEIYGVATFYSQFRLKEQGEHLVRVCRGTACHVAGSKNILDDLKKHFSLNDENDTTDDKFLTIESVACVGACSLAPVVVLDGKAIGVTSTKEVLKKIEEKR